MLKVSKRITKVGLANYEPVVRNSMIDDLVTTNVGESRRSNQSGNDLSGETMGSGWITLSVSRWKLQCDDFCANRRRRKCSTMMKGADWLVGTMSSVAG